MSVQTISYHAFLQDLEWLFRVVNKHVDAIGWTVSATNIAVPALPKRSGSDVLPYYLGAQLKAVFDYACGRREVTGDFVRDAQDAVFRMLFSCAIDSETRAAPVPDWGLLKTRPLGVILLAAMARAKVREGEWITLDELKALTGIGARRAERLGVEQKTVEGRVLCEPESVARLLERLDGEAER